MHVHRELAGAKRLSGKHLNVMGSRNPPPLVPILDARASKLGKQLRGFGAFLRKGGASKSGWSLYYLGRWRDPDYGAADLFVVLGAERGWRQREF
jgi:hypothetical protein